MNEENFTQCQRMAEECPGEVLALESCPLQFACPSTAGRGCDAYELGDACITEENLAQCRQMAERCPGDVVALETCPLQFECPSET